MSALAPGYFRKDVLLVDAEVQPDILMPLTWVGAGPNYLIYMPREKVGHRRLVWYGGVVHFVLWQRRWQGEKRRYDLIADMIGVAPDNGYISRLHFYDKSGRVELILRDPLA